MYVANKMYEYSTTTGFSFYIVSINNASLEFCLVHEKKYIFMCFTFFKRSSKYYFLQKQKSRVYPSLSFMDGCNFRLDHIKRAVNDYCWLRKCDVAAYLNQR